MLRSYTVTGSKMQKTTYSFKLIQNDMGLVQYSYAEVTLVTATTNYVLYNSQCYGVLHHNVLKFKEKMYTLKVINQLRVRQRQKPILV